MKFKTRLIGTLTAVVAGAAAVVWFGGYNVAADEPHWSVTSRILETVRQRSIAARASDVTVPKLDDEELIRRGAGNYDAMCAGCHLRPGLDRSEMSAGLYPPPPDLAQRRRADPARDFIAIKHGIKMTGMPAWGMSMKDGHIWGMVALLRKLPDLREAEYRALVDASGGHEHGGGETAAQDHHAQSPQAGGASGKDQGEASHEHAAQPAPKAAPPGHDDAAPHEH